ncbi:uncharacterized protein Nmag_0602 [Natrialba magadii ATCC 43099]|uniref:DUF8159 domain-containing protein n=1 Tax=Natrialba magadii (strain ATCC 43099 / DSM 3394 / CCM 3739 / CIP 104546 / IAM 13178 / JCM 8861 / NBRC 102185 / NCIMB 2190 / MS3) TaxID=547559 RepID=D3SYS7_NATMM|nr:hypothetical protein [Natrialba magadii]ADD04188.1 uncharacterized protein Nmag_0602 [Natrialba magadii ATCC 43099]ELY26593.1 hypothetical protein C500_15560 [Natrialba magadii ATCC 43099]
MSDERPVAVALENRLMSHGIYVTAFELEQGDRDGDEAEDEDGDGDANVDGNRHESETTGDEQLAPIVLEYETVSEAPGVTSNEVGAVLRTLLAVAEEREWQPGRLEVTSLTTDGVRRGSWHVEAAWFERLSDDLSQVEFSQRVLETISQA